MHKLLALQRGRQQPRDGAPHQQLKGSVWDQQGPAYTPAVLDCRAHIVVRQLTAWRHKVSWGQRPILAHSIIHTEYHSSVGHWDDTLRILRTLPVSTGNLQGRGMP